MRPVRPLVCTLLTKLICSPFENSLNIWEKKTGQKREKQKEQDLDKEQDQKKIKDSGQHTRGDSRSVAAFLLTLPLTNGSTSR